VLWDLPSGSVICSEDFLRVTLIPPPAQPPDPALDPHTRFSRRVGRLTLSFGIAASVAGAVMASWRTGAGFAVGTVLGWLNFLWLDRGIGAIVSAALVQQGLPQPQVPRRVYYAFAGRYALIGVVAYATVKFLHLPVLAILGGLLLLGAAAAVEGLYEVFTGSI
jgi:hypothetical protein